MGWGCAFRAWCGTAKVLWGSIPHTELLYNFQKITTMTKFTLNREETIGKEHYNVAILAMYDTKEQAMAALYALAGVLGTSVTFKADDLGGEPAIWCYSLTDYVGANYFLSEEEVDENGEIVDPMF